MMNIYDNSMNMYRSCVQGCTKGAMRSERRFFQRKVYHQCTKGKSAEKPMVSRSEESTADRARAEKSGNCCLNSRKKEKSSVSV